MILKCREKKKEKEKDGEYWYTVEKGEEKGELRRYQKGGKQKRRR